MKQLKAGADQLIWCHLESGFAGLPFRLPAVQTKPGQLPVNDWKEAELVHLTPPEIVSPVLLATVMTPLCAPVDGIRFATEPNAFQNQINCYLP